MMIKNFCFFTATVLERNHILKSDKYKEASSGRVLLLVTKKFAKRVYLNSNIRGKLFGTPTTAGLI